MRRQAKVETIATKHISGTKLIEMMTRSGSDMQGDLPACIGWIVLDGATVAGVLVRG